MGTLRISGTLSLDQFWPTGAVGRNLGSDADTVRVKVNANGVKFNGAPSSALNDAYVIDMGKKKRAVNAAGEINVRLQAVDAPELHFPTSVTGAVVHNGDFRQAWGQTATKALADFLKQKFGAGPLACEVVSQNIKNPQDVCDVHGRVVGNVQINGFDINLWLLDEGLTFPTLYSGMLSKEIKDAVARAKAARSAGKGAWADYESLAFFDPNMKFSKANNPASDKGAVLLPKFFRRSATSFVKHGSLDKLIEDIRSSKKDMIVRTRDFINGKRNFKQWGSVQGGVVGPAAGGKVKLAADPWDFVLKEEPSKLFHEVNGKQREVTKFFS